MEENNLVAIENKPFKAYKTVLFWAIICAWALLLVCFIFKIFGSKVFTVVVHNQDFINACYWLDNDGEVAKYVLAAVMYLISTPFVVLASALKPSFKTKWMFIIIPSLCVIWVVKFFHSIAGMVVEAVFLITIPAVMSKKWWTGFLGYGLHFLFQVASMYIKGQEIKMLDTNTLTTLILTIDFYIMIALYYMYAILINKYKEGKK